VIFTLSDWTNASNSQTFGLGAGVLLAVGLVGYRAGIRPGAVLVAVLWLAALEAAVVTAGAGGYCASGVAESRLRRSSCSQ